MKHNPWLKFWPQDWLTDVNLRSCSSAQRGTLIDLMCIAHRSENYGVIIERDTPEARKMLAKCLSLTVRTLDSHMTGLLQLQRICRTDDGQLFIKRMVQDHRKSLINSDNGKLGGRVSLKAPLKAEENRKEKKRTDTEGLSVLFDECWALYPHKTGKDTALKVFIKDKPEAQDVKDGINRYKASVKTQRANGFPDLKYQGGGAWFNKRRWKDECDVDGELQLDRHPTKANCTADGKPIFQS
jgi:hypothetical protein